MKMIFQLLLILLVSLVTAAEIEDIRGKRSLQPGAPDFNRDQPWQLDPQLNRDEQGNVIANVNIKRKGENNDFNAGWKKVLNGPNRAKPTYHVGGTIRWRRSLQPGAPDFNKDQPWQLDPQLARDEHGNVIANVNIKRKGENNDFNAGWNKVIKGPNRAKPTYHVGGTIRWRRSLQPGAPDFNKDQPWQLDPQLARDEHGNVIANVNIKRKGENNDFNAGWNKVINGPNRAKPTYHVGGTIRWRRSLQPGTPDFNKDQPWQLDPQLNRDEHGNVIANVNIKRKGENNDFNAGWNKVINGPNRAKPTYHIGGTIRWRRSLQPGAPDFNKDQPWQLDPQLARDEHGNVIANVNIKRKGENNDFNAGWNKVIKGPNKAKPTYHVGGTIKWRRSLQPGAPDFNKDQPWQLDPQLARDEHGNVIANVNIKRKGENNDFNAGWNKVINGPNRAKPTYHVGGTIRWRRSLQPGAPDFNKDQPWQLDPQLARDEHGNVIANVNIKRKGENNDFEASWNKVVDGPNRSKPTYHVGGTIRWR